MNGKGNQLRNFDALEQTLGKLYPKLPRYMAIVAVNFFKSRFREGRDINNIPFKKRKLDKSKRAILVGKGSGKLKRDIKTEKITATEAIVSTTSLTVPYAQAHNEGVNTTVSVKGHKRGRYKKVRETFTSKAGNERNRTSRQHTGNHTTVGTYRRKMELPQRQFMGSSVQLDKRLTKMVTQQIIKTIEKATQL
jgi:phage gpG-like protein